MADSVSVKTPEKGGGNPLAGDIKIGKTKVPKWLVLVAAGGGVLALYFGTRSGANPSDSGLGGGVAQPNGESLGTGGTPADNTALLDALNSGFAAQSQAFSDLANAIANQQIIVNPPMLAADSYPTQDYGGNYAQEASPSLSIAPENLKDMSQPLTGAAGPKVDVSNLNNDKWWRDLQNRLDVKAGERGSNLPEVKPAYTGGSAAKVLGQVDSMRERGNRISVRESMISPTFKRRSFNREEVRRPATVRQTSGGGGGGGRSGESASGNRSTPAAASRPVATPRPTKNFVSRATHRGVDQE